MSVSTVTPIYGTTNTPIVITGTGLTQVTQVRMGELARIGVSTDTSLTIYAPPSEVNTSILLEMGQTVDAGLFYYLNPSITSIDPTEGEAFTDIAIYGFYLNNTSQVRIGNRPSDSFYFVDEVLYATLPEHTGSQTVYVEDIYGNVVQGPDFSYQTTVIRELIPNGAPTGALVALYGEYLLYTDKVYVGGQLVPLETVSQTMLEWYTPTGEGNVSIEIVNYYGASTLYNGSFRFENPKVTYVATLEGPSNSEISVYGLYLQNTSVRFGTVQASTRIVSTGLEVTVPPWNASQDRNVSVFVYDSFLNTQVFSFQIQNPLALSLSPVEAMEGTTILIEGEYLQDTSRVFFGIREVPVVEATPSTVQVTAPLLLENVSVHTEDLYGNRSTVPIGFTPKPSMMSTTCFPAGTLVTTDQGDIEIQKLIVGTHTILNRPIRAITCTLSMDPKMVRIEKESLRKNTPTRDTLISQRHKVYDKGRMISAQRLVGRKGIMFVPYPGIPLYNVVCEGRMKVHGMICETLDPMNPITPYFERDYRTDP